MVRDEGGGKIGRGLHTTPSLHFRPICAPICAPFASKKPLGSPIFGFFSLAAMDFFSYRRMAEEGQGHEPHAPRRSTAGALRMAEDEQI